jgi:hypothetical protein
MPIIGKDFQRPREPEPKQVIKLVPVKPEIKLIPILEVVLVEEKLYRISTYLIHPSRLIEPEYFKEVMESSRRDGIRVPLRVRPCNCKLLNVPHFEVFDGHSRHAGKDTNESMLCEVRDLTDDEALHEMLILETKGHKSAYWKAQLIAKLVEIKENEMKEKGIDKGAKKEVANIINRENIESGQVLVAQYLKINELFSYLKTLKSITNDDLMRIKRLDKDNLLNLANLSRGLLPQVLEVWKRNPSISILDARREVVGYRPHYPSSKPKHPGKEKVIVEPTAFTLPITPDLLQRIRRIKSWIMEILEEEVKGTGIHWTKRNKILYKFAEKRDQTILQIAQDCLVMGIEDVEHGFREGSISLHFETVNGVPIGYKTIFKKRMKPSEVP